MKFMESELSGCKEELSDALQQVEKVRQQYEKQLGLKNSEVSLNLMLPDNIAFFLNNTALRNINNIN